MPPHDAARSLLRTSLPAGPPPRSCLPSQASMTQHQGPPSGLGLGGGRGSQREAKGERRGRNGGGSQGRRWEERQRWSIRIRMGVPVAALKGLESEWEPGMTVSRSKLMIM